MSANFVSVLVAVVMVTVSAVALTMIPHVWNAWLEEKPARRRKLARVGLLRLLTDEVGGYVHDTAMSQFIPPGSCHYVTGTWTDAAGAVANTIAKSKAAADNTAVVTIPIILPQNSVAQKGAYLKTIDVWWEVLTAAMDAVTPVIYKATLPADTAAFAAPASQAFTYDTGHDTAGERLTLDQHKMTLALTTPFWIDDDDLVTVAVTFDAAATSALTFFGARANYTLRV